MKILISTLVERMGDGNSRLRGELYWLRNPRHIAGGCVGMPQRIDWNNLLWHHDPQNGRDGCAAAITAAVFGSGDPDILDKVVQFGLGITEFCINLLNIDRTPFVTYLDWVRTYNTTSAAEFHANYWKFPELPLKMYEWWYPLVSVLKTCGSLVTCLHDENKEGACQIATNLLCHGREMMKNLAARATADSFLVPEQAPLVEIFRTYCESVFRKIFLGEPALFTCLSFVRFVTAEASP